MSRDDWDAICKDLDKFIQDNLEIEEAHFNALPDPEKTKQRLDAFISKVDNSLGNGENDGSFSKFLEEMRKKLDLKKSDIYNAAKITRDHYSKLINKEMHPGKYTIIAIGFAFISADRKKSIEEALKEDKEKGELKEIYRFKEEGLLNKLKSTPEEIMKKLLFLGGGIFYELKNTSPRDLVIKFCLNPIGYVFNVEDVNYLLRYEGLLELPLKEKCEKGADQCQQ